MVEGNSPSSICKSVNDRQHVIPQGLPNERMYDFLDPEFDKDVQTSIARKSIKCFSLTELCILLGIDQVKIQPSYFFFFLPPSFFFFFGLTFLTFGLIFFVFFGRGNVIVNFLEDVIRIFLLDGLLLDFGGFEFDLDLSDLAELPRDLMEEQEAVLALVGRLS